VRWLNTFLAIKRPQVAVLKSTAERRRARLAAVFLMLVTALSTARAAEAAVPYQFIAKMYSEGLGRIPDQGGWRGYVNYFSSNGCSVQTVRTVGRDFYLSVEFAGLGYDNASRLLALYRGALNREPDAGGFHAYLTHLNGGASWQSVVDAVFSSSEFRSLVNGWICPQTRYYFGTAPAIDIPISGTGFEGTRDQLQAVIDATPAGGTVWLKQKAVVRITSPLTIKAGVTLATTGNPSHNQYALMARLVRHPGFVSGQPLVQVDSGARLLNVWVDGQRGDPNNYVVGLINVQMRGGSGTTVSGSRISNTYGWTNLHALSTAEGWPCASNTITNNLVEAYSSEHWPYPGGVGKWSDGLSIACENAIVADNEVIDATDVAIVLYTASSTAATATQQSQVRYNRILNAGNSAYGAIGADPLADRQGVPHSFAGSSINNNTFWTGDGHYDIALAVGTRAWFGSASNLGYSASFDANTTGSESAAVDIAIGISGMGDVWVQNNVLLVLVRDSISTCPGGNIVASVTAGWTWGSIQGPYSDVNIPHCVGH
jgi:hypothetical protein